MDAEVFEDLLDILKDLTVKIDTNARAIGSLTAAVERSSNRANVQPVLDIMKIGDDLIAPSKDALGRPIV